MADFHFSIPIEARYGDLDPQWHVNNSRFLTFMEQARMAYLVHLGLWDGVDFNRLGLIVADVHAAYLAPMMLWQPVRMEIRAAKLGNKSLTFEYRLVDTAQGKILFTAETVMVAYDYDAHASMPVPALWRERISAFDGIPEKTP